MSVSEILKTIGESIHSSSNVKNVYGDSITGGGRTVIPVASVAYGFGGGGGGHMSARPAGALEIFPIVAPHLLRNAAQSRRSTRGKSRAHFRE